MLSRENESLKELKTSSFELYDYSDIFNEYGIKPGNEEDEIVINIEGKMKLLSEDEYKEHINHLNQINLNEDDDDDWDDYWDDEDDDEEE